MKVLIWDKRVEQQRSHMAMLDSIREKKELDATNKAKLTDASQKYKNKTGRNPIKIHIHTIE